MSDEEKPDWFQVDDDEEEIVFVVNYVKTFDSRSEAGLPIALGLKLIGSAGGAISVEGLVMDLRGIFLQSVPEGEAQAQPGNVTLVLLREGADRILGWLLETYRQNYAGDVGPDSELIEALARWGREIAEQED